MCIYLYIYMYIYILHIHIHSHILVTTEGVSTTSCIQTKLGKRFASSLRCVTCWRYSHSRIHSRSHSHCTHSQSLSRHPLKVVYVRKCRLNMCVRVRVRARARARVRARVRVHMRMRLHVRVHVWVHVCVCVWLCVCVCTRVRMCVRVCMPPYPHSRAMRSFVATGHLYVCVATPSYQCDDLHVLNCSCTLGLRVHVCKHVHAYTYRYIYTLYIHCVKKYTYASLYSIATMTIPLLLHKEFV